MLCCLILLSGNGKHACLPISLDMSPLQYERKCPERYASAIVSVANYNLNDCQSTKSFIFAWMFSDSASSLCPSFLITQRKPRCCTCQNKWEVEVRPYISSEFTTKHWIKRLEVWVKYACSLCEGLG